MNCFVCARSGEVQPAVGLCRHCQMALCMHHFAEARRGPGGTQLGCAHPLPARQAAAGAVGR